MTTATLEGINGFHQRTDPTILKTLKDEPMKNSTVANSRVPVGRPSWCEPRAAKSHDCPSGSSSSWLDLVSTVVYVRYAMVATIAPMKGPIICPKTTALGGVLVICAVFSPPHMLGSLRSSGLNNAS